MLDELKLSVKALGGRITRTVSGPHARAILTETPEGRFLVGVDDFTIGRRLRLDGQYGADEIERIAGLADPESRVLVVGAHVGTLAIPLARRTSRVDAIEASPQTFELLCLNVVLNALENCHPRQLAASDAPGRLEMLEGTVNSGGNKRVPARLSRRYTFDRPTRVEVEANRLDDAYPHDSFDVIVMDIEGSEYFALRGMPRLLSEAKALVVEFVPHHLQDVADITLADFLEPIRPHFTTMEVPSLGVQVDVAEAERVLAPMMQDGRSDDGLVFRR